MAVAGFILAIGMACPDAVGQDCPGDGDCCSSNGSAGCEDLACCNAVCGADAFCCDTAWDGICATAALKLCGVCGAGCPGDGDCCDPAGNGTPGCIDEACCVAVCAADPFCCDNVWDGICAGQAQATCQVCNPCQPDSGDCCSVNPTPGCNDVECCQTVCAGDPFCCDNAWDEICVGQAQAECGVCACPGIGDCCAPGGNGTPGCNDAECCDAVCALDPFCCDNSWDSICASQAAATCVLCETACLLEANFDGSVVGAPVGTGGAALGEPVSVATWITAIVRAEP
ncbi:MAG: hypothetical protein ACYTF9_05810, partial [Planctomycetota bacterium]